MEKQSSTKKQGKQSKLMFQSSYSAENEVIYLVEADDVEVAFAIVAPNSAIVLQTQLLTSTTHSSILLFLYKS